MACSSPPLLIRDTWAKQCSPPVAVLIADNISLWTPTTNTLLSRHHDPRILPVYTNFNKIFLGNLIEACMGFKTLKTNNKRSLPLLSNTTTSSFAPLPCITSQLRQVIKETSSFCLSLTCFSTTLFITCSELALALSILFLRHVLIRLATSQCPLPNAQSSAVNSLRSLASNSAPLSSKSSAVSTWPFRAAQCKGDQPSHSTILGSAPAERRSLIHEVAPVSEVQSSGVSPVV